MRKTVINVPKGIKYLSDWKEFCLPDTPTIIDKQITGCGFTEYCLSNHQNVILCSPRRILLENKEEQHKPKKDENGKLILPIPMPVYYAKNESENILDVDKDLNPVIPSIKKATMKITEEEIFNATQATMELRDGVKNYLNVCKSTNRPCKILVTYDSFRHVKEALGSDIQYFNVVIDEFQVIFGDSKFKSTTEIEFLTYLMDLQSVCFVSATPMMEEFLDKLDEFKDLPYYILDWGVEDPNRITKPFIESHYADSIISVAKRIIGSYQVSNFEKFIYVDLDGSYKEIESKEVVIYVNSVKNICDIIKYCKLSVDNTNVLCSKNDENEQKVRKAFGLKKKQLGGIGSVPKRGDPHKMFTLCTRTVYLGADFYSTCARTVILSDANIDCMAADITLDLPQILGRQRNEMNPWKNRAELYFRTTLVGNKVSTDEFKALVSKKKSRTTNLLSAWTTSATREIKHDLAENFETTAKVFNYRDNYVAVNKHNGSDLVPVFNNLVLIAEIRSFQIQQVEYANRCTVRNNISRISKSGGFNEEIRNFLDTFNNYTQFVDRMRLLCNYQFSNLENIIVVLNNIPLEYSNYYNALGPDRIISLSCQRGKLEKELQGKIAVCQPSLENKLDDYFKVGEKYTLKYIKKTLKEIYESLYIFRTPKAVDLEEFFNIRKSKIVNQTTGKKENCMELLSKK